MKRERLLNVIGQIDDRLVAGADPQARVRQKRIRHQWIAALAACLVLALGIGIVAPIALGNREAGKVTMEINPGVEYTITENGKVSAVRFLNEDAKEVLGEASLKGEHLKSAISLTLAAYKIGGYMERNDTVLISFDRRLSENGRLKESVAKDVRQVLEAETAVHTLVYVSESDGADAAAIAEKYGISQGKAKLVGDAAKNSELSEEALAKLPLDELVGLQKELDSVVIDTRYIGLSKAKAIALSDAGCTLVRVTFTEARLIDEGNRYPYYSLVFSDGQTQWNYSINAINGDILAKNETTLLLSLEEARAIALKDAGIDGSLPEEKVVFTKEELSRNQGRPCWVLEFYTAKYQYSYKIDAKTGEIIYFEYHIDILKAKEIALNDAGCGEYAVFTEEKLVSGGIKTPYYLFVFNDGRTQWTYRIDAVLGIILDKNAESLLVPLEKAKEIALADAGITDGERPVFTKEVLSRNQGRPCWVLEFYTAKYQYVYKIDVRTGEIIYNRRYIYMEVARETARADSGCSAEARIEYTVEELIDGGIKTPYYRFVFNDGRTQWSYRIDAVQGGILEKNAESLFVPLEKAKEIALADAGITDGERPVFTKEVLSRNQGRPCWVLEFYTAKYQYVYKIDVRTGEIIYNRRYIYMEVARETARADSGCSAEARIEYTVEELIDGGIKTPYYRFVFNDGRTQWSYRIDAVQGGILEKNAESLFVPLEKAKEIALADAEITDAERPVFTKEELNRNQGRPCWVLEFYTAKYQYVYKIDARTGEIIYSRRYINMEVARETARADSGCPAEGRIEFTAEELIDGGIKTPYYLFVFNDGRTQWTYRIDATNGGILAKAQEPMPV